MTTSTARSVRALRSNVVANPDRIIAVIMALTAAASALGYGNQSTRADANKDANYSCRDELSEVNDRYLDHMETQH